MDDSGFLSGTKNLIVGLLLIGALFYLGNKVSSVGAEAKNDAINAIVIKNYGTNRVLEFVYEGEVESGQGELKKLSKDEIWITAVGPEGEKTNFTFKKDIEPMKIIQVDIPDDTVSVGIFVKGGVYLR